MAVTSRNPDMNSSSVTAQIPRPFEHNVPHDRTIIDYARLLYKRRRIAVPVFLVTFVISSVNAVRQTPIYDARAQVMVEPQTPTVVSLDQIFESRPSSDDNFINTQLRIIRSREVSKRALDALQLWDAPQLGNGPTPKPQISLIPYFWRGANALVSLVKPDPPARTTETSVRQEAPKPTPENAESPAQASRIGQFLSGISATPIRDSNIVEVHYTSTDPEFAAMAANATAKAYIQQNLELRFNSSKEATDWLSDRLADQRKTLEASEGALQAYREQHGAVPAIDNTSSITVQRLADLSASLTKARMDRINKEALYKQLQAASSIGALDSYQAVASNGAVQKVNNEIADLQRQQAQLAQRYGDRHPEMIRVRSLLADAQAKRTAEIGKVVESAKHDLEATVETEQTLQAALNTQRSEALSLNRQGIELSVLQRDVDSNKQIYETLLQRTKETGISAERRTTNIRIVDEASVPGGPVSPNIQRDLTFSFGACLLLAVAIAFGLEQIDNRIRTPQELKAFLGVPFLGMVPTSPTKGSMNPLSENNLAPGFLEAFKTIRTNVLFSSADEGMRALVVTSAAPSEGKSVVAANLAVALAQAGRKVLLVDADMRRPRVHEMFGLPQEPGLSNVLATNADPDATVTRSNLDGLWLLAAGQLPPNPAELLASPRFQELLTHLQQQKFEYVIIDTPPVLAVADSMIAGNSTSGVIFVVRSDKTARQSARTAVEQLDAAGARIAGAVLNHVNVGRHPYYYTGHYRKDYTRYYTKT